MAGIMLRSPAFSDHAQIPHRHAKDGDNRSPALDWSDIPKDTSELVLFCEDADAPGWSFAHWVVAGLDPASSGLAEGKLPAGAVEGKNGFGKTGYDGPEPPIGDEPHRYFFRLYALKEPSGFESGGSVEDLKKVVGRKEIASGTLVGTYER